MIFYLKNYEDREKEFIVIKSLRLGDKRIGIWGMR